MRIRLAPALLALLLALPALAGKKTEEEWIAQLASPDEGKVTQALQGLEKEYPDSPTARAKVAAMLKDPRVKVHRKAARVLGALHAEVTPEQLKDMAALLDSADAETIVDGLKALRGVKSAPAIPRMLPLLKHPDEHVQRDTCRTLAEVGDRSLVPQIEPLLSDPNKKVQEDARDAIARLKMK